MLAHASEAQADVRRSSGRYQKILFECLSFFEVCYVDFFGGRGDDGECVSVVQVGWCGCFFMFDVLWWQCARFWGLGEFGE